MHFRGKKLTREFYNVEINSLVVRKSDWQKRSIDFYLDNGMILNLRAPDQGRLRTGDLIKKPKNTYVYNIYRRNSEGRYEIVEIRDYRDNRLVSDKIMNNLK